MTTTAIASYDFGEFHGIVIGFRRADRYVNATALLKTVGKEWAHYWKNSDTQAFLSELSLELRILSSGKRGDRPLLCEVGKGGRPTWVHPRVAWHLGQWASPELASWVTGILDRLSLGLSITPGDQQRAVETFATKADLAELRLVVDQKTEVLGDKIQALGWQVADVAQAVESVGARVEHHAANQQALGEQLGFDIADANGRLLFVTERIAVSDSKKKHHAGWRPGQLPGLDAWRRPTQIRLL